MTDSNNVWHRLQRAMRQVDPANPDGVWQMITSGTVNIVGGGAGGTAMVDNNPFTPGGTSITPIGGYVGGRTIASGNAAAPAMNASGMLIIAVGAGGAGGGFAQLQVVGSDNSNFVNVGWPSGGSPTLNAIPVQVMNQSAGGGGFASTAVYGSPAMPVYVVGSMNVVNAVGILGVAGSVQITGSINPHGIFAPAGSVNVVGSVGATQLGAPWSFVGSTSVTPLAAFSLSGVPMIDTRASLTPTQWIISGAASGQFVVAGSAPANLRVKISSYHLIATGTVDLQWMSPSGVAVTGSMRLLPGAGFGMAGHFPNGPVLIGSQQSAVYILSAGTQNIGGVAIGTVD